MAHGRARDERKERQWRRWISQWRASGLSGRAFCDRHGLATPSFYHWRRVLQRRAVERSAFVPAHSASVYERKAAACCSARFLTSAVLPSPQTGRPLAGEPSRA